MKKVQKEKQVVIAKVNEYLAAWNGGYKSLSEQANINYFAARRALIHGLKNDTKLVTDLCTFFNIDQLKFKEVQNTTLESLTTTLRETWDGSVHHAELLHSLIKSTKPFKVRARTG